MIHFSQVGLFGVISYYKLFGLDFITNLCVYQFTNFEDDFDIITDR